MISIIKTNFTVFRVVVFLLCLSPAAYLIAEAILNRLGPDPGKAIAHFTGIWALRMLWLTLAISPLRRLTGWGALLKLRRMLGLYVFFYTCLHVLSYLTFLLGWDFRLVADEIIKRPYIFVGSLAFVGLFLLAFTSTKGWQRRLKKKWKKLHFLIYPISLLALLHFTWALKSGVFEPVMYGLVLFVLLFSRKKSKKRS